MLLGRHELTVGMIPPRTIRSALTREEVAAWDRAVARMASATPFSLAAWLDAKARSEDATPVYLAGDDDRWFVGAVRYVGDPDEIYIPHGPVGVDPSAVMDALACLRSLAPDARLRLGPNYPMAAGGADMVRLLKAEGYVETDGPWHRATVVVDLDSDAVMLGRASAHMRRKLQAARSKGVEVEARFDEPAARDFASLYDAFAAERSLAPIPESFFRRLVTSPTDEPLGTMLFVRSAEALCSAALILRIGELSWLSRSPCAPGQEPFGAALEWAAMTWARDNGCSRYDLGGIELDGELGQRTAGLTRFKLSLGGQVVRTVPEHEWVP